MGGYGAEGSKPMQPLFETKQVKGRVASKVLASTIFLGICLILVYRLKHIPSAEEHDRWAWIGLFMVELWFGFYWILLVARQGWKPVYFSPHKSAFLGVAPTTLDQSLIQDKRWSEGLFQILLSKYCLLGQWPPQDSNLGGDKALILVRCPPVVRVTSPGFELGTLTQTVALLVPSGLLAQMVSSLWFLPFAYVFVAKNAYSILETVSCGETFKTLWNFERMWMMRSATSYLFAFIDNLIMLFGLSETTFVITAKVADEDVLKRYQHEIIEFGSSSLTFTIISTLALLNLFSSVGGIKKVIFEFRAAAGLIPHVILCGVTVMLHVPVYEALFVRNDEGQIPSSVMFKSIIVASLACLMPYLLYN
ncbi:Cellulose synthase-like protein E6 [Vitis vinifera]|uniref:Cellulose synthase-like protein E6 n=1 Tax=Vitis vinifera TaxID=29760 RepID=A0A438ER01_VITVI|nr:Cellulose synthase-like protein E6 [Vitis vinifera]